MAGTHQAVKALDTSFTHVAAHPMALRKLKSKNRRSVIAGAREPKLKTVI